MSGAKLLYNMGRKKLWIKFIILEVQQLLL